MSGRTAYAAVAAAALAAVAFACDESVTPAAPVDAGDPPSPGFAAECRGLGLTKAECDRWSTVVLKDALPAARGNRYADNLDAAKLGFALFFDLGLSSQKGKKIRCANCHSPERAFADKIPLPTGILLVPRNAPALVNSARTHPHFWDGRADSLFSQSLLTIEDDDEMDGNRLTVAHRVYDAYRADYERAFGPMPDLSDAGRFPPEGKPGMAAWDAMSAADRDAVTQVYVNVGKSFEAYIRKIATGRSAVDRFLLGDTHAISDAAKVGFRAFTQAGCLNCHYGESLTDGRFHQLDLPLPGYAPWKAASEKDRGRAEGIDILAKSEFNSASRYYDRPGGEPPRMEEDLTPVEGGLFLTPSLRNVGETAPYGHNGVFATLEEAVRFHLTGGGPKCRELPPHPLSDNEVAGLVEFLQALHGDTAPLPWSFWPKLSGDAGADAYSTEDAGGGDATGK